MIFLLYREKELLLFIHEKFSKKLNHIYLQIVNPIQGIKTYLAKNTMNLKRGILNLGAKNLNRSWSVNKTPKNVPKKVLASLLVV